MYDPIGRNEIKCPLVNRIKNTDLDIFAATFENLVLEMLLCLVVEGDHILLLGHVTPEKVKA